MGQNGRGGKLPVQRRKRLFRVSLPAVVYKFCMLPSVAMSTAYPRVTHPVDQSDNSRPDQRWVSFSEVIGYLNERDGDIYLHVGLWEVGERRGDFASTEEAVLLLQISESRAGHFASIAVCQIDSG